MWREKSSEGGATKEDRQTCERQQIYSQCPVQYSVITSVADLCIYSLARRSATVLQYKYEEL